MQVDVLYFAWLRERIGVPRETIQTEARTLRELVAQLSQQDEWHRAALSDLSAVRVAIDQELADLDAPLGTPREIAFFPPMTGG
ncbi:molybdopterin converting factor subunit 1 [Paracoccus sp. (in: a-proteobacteria)]|uniref:molybdopterin converting factor subunit 1 n=1 Tax=Paracoccus sp. TaxID=267 RepID=UPI0028A1B122|nr:molybdopterin converting factor subunit 1 [Paracoccus sp. (in: a-proteobacteria)]